MYNNSTVYCTYFSGCENAGCDCLHFRNTLASVPWARCL